MIFWLIAVALALLSAGLLVRPLLKARAQTARRADYDIAVYKDQLAEIDGEVDRGVLTADQAEAAKVEVQRRMLAAASRGEREGAPKDPAQTVPRVARSLVTSLILLIPLASVALYLGIGSPGMPDFPFAQRLEEARAEEQKARQAAESQIADLRGQLEAAPDSLEIRIRLARLLLRSGSADEARSLMAKAAQSAPQDPLVQAEYGQFLVSAARGEIGAEAHATFQRVLSLDPTDPRGRFFLGLERLQLNDPAGALAIWRDLKDDTPPDAPWAEMLDSEIRTVAMEAGIPPISITPTHPSRFPEDSWTAETAASATQALAGQGGSGQGGSGQGETGADPDPGAAMRAEADANRAPGQGFSDDERAMINDMVAGLQARLESEPEDFDGWMMLGRSMTNLNRPAEAADAFAKAAALRPDDLTPKRMGARALMAQSQAEGATEPPAAIFPLMEAILAADPKDTEALFFMGLRAANAGDTETARSHWTTLLDGLPDSGPLTEQIKRRLDALPQ